MDFLSFFYNMKRSYQILLGVVVSLLALYILPNFIDLKDHKEFIEQKIEENFGFKASIGGRISFTIFPRPSLILNNVQIYSKDENSKAGILVNAHQVFINTDITNILNRKFTIKRAGFVNATFYATSYRISGYENLDKLLNGKLFKQLFLKNSRIVFPNEFINNIDVTLKVTSDEKLKGYGKFDFKDGTVDDLTVVLSYLNKENYNLVTDFSYIQGRNRMKNNLTFIVKENEKTYSGSTELLTNNITKFIQHFNPKFVLPQTPMFKEKLIIKTSFQNSADAILLTNGSLEGSNVVATFKGKLPFIANSNYKINTKEISLNFDFVNLVLDRVMEVNVDVAQNPLATLTQAKPLLELFKFAKINIFAKSIILHNAVMNDFKLSTEPIYYDDKFNGLDVKNLSYQILKNTFSLKGKLLNIPDNMTLDAFVKTDVPFNISNIFGTRLKITNFVSNVTMAPDLIRLSNLSSNIGETDISGEFSYAKPNGVPEYNANLKSEFINLDNIFREKIDLPFIISKLSSLTNSKFNLSTAFKKFKMNRENYNELKLKSDFADGTLRIKNLTFKDNDYSSHMKGDLVDITGTNGKFKDFEYKISSSTLKGLTLPFIRNTFIEKMIANGVNQINILLNGDADNPISSVDANLNNIRVKVKGKLLDSNSEYSIELSHNELKGFLFSWGYIDANLMNYLYDNIPFTVFADIKGDNINNIKLKIKNNDITGSITREKVKKETVTSVKFNAEKLDIKGVIKRIRETDGYVDLILKLVRLLSYNLYVSADVLDDYDKNSYQDFVLDIQNVENPGRLKFALKKGDYEIDLDSEIVNSNVFEGNIDISNFTVPKDLMNNELLNLVSGTVNSNIKFKTFGTSAYQLLSNLSGDFDLNILDGVIKGISDYDTIFANIVNLSNITTNNVIYSLEASLKSGQLGFSDLSIKGKLNEASIENAGFKLTAPNIDVSGMVSGNLIQKSLNIESVFDIANLSPNKLTIMYNLKGYINNLTGRIDTSSLISKINTIYLQKKKKDSM